MTIGESDAVAAVPTLALTSPVAPAMEATCPMPSFRRLSAGGAAILMRVSTGSADATMRAERPKMRGPITRCLLSIISALTLIMASAAAVSAQSQEDTVRSVARPPLLEAVAHGDALAALALLHLEVLIFEGGRAETK